MKCDTGVSRMSFCIATNTTTTLLVSWFFYYEHNLSFKLLWRSNPKAKTVKVLTSLNTHKVLIVCNVQLSEVGRNIQEGEEYK
jgi:hypothetical protein